MGENIYGWVKDPFFGHVGFNVDWGVPALDHRANVMGLLADTPDFKEVGVSYVPTTLPDFGPQRRDGGLRRSGRPGGGLCAGGSSTATSNGNGAYDQGEGLAGVTVMPNSGTYYAVTATPPAASSSPCPPPARAP